MVGIGKQSCQRSVDHLKFQEKEMRGDWNRWHGCQVSLSLSLSHPPLCSSPSDCISLPLSLSLSWAWAVWSWGSSRLHETPLHSHTPVSQRVIIYFQGVSRSVAHTHTHQIIISEAGQCSSNVHLSVNQHKYFFKACQMDPWYVLLRYHPLAAFSPAALI